MVQKITKKSKNNQKKTKIIKKMQNYKNEVQDANYI